MSVKASPTAAAAPAERREQPAASPAIAHASMANAIRALAMDAVEQAKSGHPGMPMGMADVATVLFTRFLKFDPASPTWPDRDRFVLSAGHGSMLLYALLYLTGYEAMTIEQIKRFRQLGSITAGHPEYGHVPGAETTTGPLGQGLANAVGMAIAEKHLAARVRRQRRQSQDLRDRVRRRPDGRHQPGSDRARWPPEAQQADRAVRRQRHLYRRRIVALPTASIRSSASKPPAGVRRASTDTIQRQSVRRWRKRKSPTSRSSSLARPQSASARRPRPAKHRRMARPWAATRSKAHAKNSAGRRHRLKCRRIS